MSRNTTTTATATDHLAAIGELAITAQRSADAAKVGRSEGRMPQGPDGQRDLDRQAGEAAAALRAAIDEINTTGFEQK
jgi:hypothetical protein